MATTSLGGVFGGVTPTVETAYTNFRGFFDSMRIPSNAAKGFLETAMADKNSQVYSFLSDQTVWTTGGPLDVRETAPRLDFKRINEWLSPAEREILNRNYGSFYKLEFTNSMRVGHALACASRSLETEIVLGLCDHSASIGDVGGNPASHVRAGRTNVKSFCPLLSDRDMARVTDRFSAIRSGLNSRNSKVVNACADFLKTPSKYMLQTRAEDDFTPMKTLLFIHSVYDFSINTLTRMMENHESEVAYGVFMYSDAVLDSDSGQLPELGAWFNKHDDGVIRFGFDNDPSHTYEHQFDDYKGYLVDQVLNGKKYSYYYQTHLTSRNTMFFTVTRLQTQHMTYERMVPTKIMKHRAPKVSITTFELDYTKKASSPDFVVPHQETIPYQFYHDCLSFAFARMQDDTKSGSEPLTPDVFFRQCRTLNRFVSVNGVPLSGMEKVDPLALKRVSWSLYHLAIVLIAHRRVRIGQGVKQLLKRRELSKTHFWDNVYRYFTTFLPEVTNIGRMIDQVGTYLKESATKDVLEVVAREEEQFHCVERLLAVSTFESPPVDYTVQPPDEAPDFDLERDDLVIMRELASKSGNAVDTKFFDSKLAGTSAPEQQQPVYEPNVEASSEETELNYRKRVTKLEHDPTCRRSAEEFRQQAVDEFVEYMRVDYQRTTRAALSLMNETWSGTQPRQILCEQKRGTVESPNYLLFQNGVCKSSIVPTEKQTYMYGVCPFTKEFVNIRTKKGENTMRARHSGWLFVCNELSVLVSGNIVTKSNEFLKKSGLGNMPEVYCSQGVVGSGKTHRLCDAFDINILIASVSSATADEIAMRLRSRFKESGTPIPDNILMERVRTLDSLTLNPYQRASTLVVDEAFMAHSGQLYLTAAMVGAEKLVVSGDLEQIGFINRHSDFVATPRSSLVYYDHYELWYLMRRSNVDVAVAANKLCYGGMAKSLKGGPRSMFWERIADEHDPKFISMIKEANLVIACYKAEKEMILKACKRHSIKNKDVRTVHEAQGNDKPVVLFTRLLPTEGPLYNSEKHPFVGCTRHSQKLMCAEVVPGSTAQKFIDYGQDVKEWDDTIYEGDPNTAVYKFF